METTTTQGGQVGTKVLRKIVRIDGSRCNGCAACIAKCGQSALKLVGERVIVVDEELCDGLGLCVGACPTNAIIMEDRYALPFREGPAIATGSHDGQAGDEFRRRLSICCRATECRRICMRLIKQPGKAGVWCVDIVTGEKVRLYDVLARSDFRCPDGHF